MNIEQFRQLFPLPDNWTYSAILLIFFGIAPFFVRSISPLTRLCSALSEARNRKVLMERLSRGSYDKETIHQSTKHYIRPKCSNIDPAQEEEPRQALMATRESLFDKIDYFIDHGSSKRHLLILADSGTGKTSLVLNYYAYNYRQRASRCHNLLLVYLGFTDADNQIREHENKKETIIFLDALDEDTKAIDNHRTRIRELMEMCRDYRRVIITCRTQFFPNDEEVPVETGIARLGPRKAGEKGEYEFWKLYISPFDDNDINLYLQKRFPVWRLGDRNKAQELAFQVKSLSARPMLLAHIPDVVKSDTSITQSYQLYQLMVDAWLERESSWVKKSYLREYSERLSVNLYVCREKRGMERIPYNELVQLARDWNIDLPQWQLSGRSLLNRDAQGNYKFAHRSIMEFLFVNRLLKRDINCNGIILTDQMKDFLIERILPEGNNQSINAALRDMLKNEVFVSHGEGSSHVSVRSSNIDQVILNNESVDCSSEQDAFINNLDYASICVCFYVARLQKRMPLPAVIDDQISGLRDIIDSALMDENDTIPNISNPYLVEILKLAFPILALTPDKLARKFSDATKRQPYMLYRMIIDEMSVSATAFTHYFNSTAVVLENVRPPKEIHQGVKRFINLYRAAGLLIYYIVNNSGLCTLKPRLSSLHRFELIIKSE
jgi:hypothetical protein